MIEKTVMQFFLDGYDTTANFISAVIYFIGIHQDVQVLIEASLWDGIIHGFCLLKERILEEAEAVAMKCGENLNGEDILELKYLDQV